MLTIASSSAVSGMVVTEHPGERFRGASLITLHSLTIHGHPYHLQTLSEKREKASAPEALAGAGNAVVTTPVRRISGGAGEIERAGGIAC